MEMATLVIYEAADKVVTRIKSTTAAAAATADKNNALSLMLLAQCR
jgi:hypothetical protein